MKDILNDIDYLYIYRGKVRVKMEHNYGKLGPRGGGTSKCRYSILERGECLNPLNVTSIMQTSKHQEDQDLAN
jgi:hypothetical protein